MAMKRSRWTREMREFAFWERVDISTKPDACWPWIGATNQCGYGTTSAASFGMRARCGAHRVAWVIKNGPIPSGMWVLHRCDNPPCCNPAYLFLGTNVDNMRDMAKKGRGRSVLTDELLTQIVSMFASEVRPAAIARELGLNESTVRNVTSGRRYRAWAEHRDERTWTREVGR